MLNLYVVRHGQTDWNIQTRMQGRTDIPLNSTGIKQAQETALALKDIPIDFIISSPLKRALDTANYINFYKNVPILIDERIIERSFGELEGKTKDDLSNFHVTINELLDYSLNYSIYNIENIHNLFMRTELFINEIKNTNADKNILISTHNGVAQTLDIILNKLPKTTNLLDVSFKNCEYRRYIINDSK